MQNKLHIYIDDSGTDNFFNNRGYNKGFSLCGALIEDNNTSKIKQELEKFRIKWASKLGRTLTFLHDREIDKGILNGEGDYALLHEDPSLQNLFISELQELLQSLPYSLISLGWNQSEYITFLKNSVNKYYAQKNEAILGISYMQQSLYPLLLSLFSQEIYKLLNTKDYEKYNQIVFWPEYKSDNVSKNNFVQEFINVLAKKRPMYLAGFIKKSDTAYPCGLEIADLCANALRNHMFNTGKQNKAYAAIENKVVFCKVLTMLDYVNSFGQYN